MSDILDEQFNTLVPALTEGNVVPFLGAGVNLCDRPPGNWDEKSDYLPSGAELADYLAKKFNYTDNDKLDLLRVSQYVATMAGSGPLYNKLRSILKKDGYKPNSLHNFFAKMTPLLHQKGFPVNCPLIVTTNYDDLMERAFEGVGQPVDVVAYVADHKQYRGKFWHWKHDGSVELIHTPNQYFEFEFDKRPVILKIHGAFDRQGKNRDSFVITEDHYIDYLTRTDISNLMPIQLAEKLYNSHFLFLGYSLRDWNLRVILHRIWGEQALSYTSWAIQLNPQMIDQKAWGKRDVEILNVDLKKYIDELNNHIEGL